MQDYHSFIPHDKRGGFLSIFVAKTAVVIHAAGDDSAPEILSPVTKGRRSPRLQAPRLSRYRAGCAAPYPTRKALARKGLRTLRSLRVPPSARSMR